MLNKYILQKLSALGFYGSRTISILDLKMGIKTRISKEFENCLLDLLKREIIIISNSSGQPRVSLNPKKKAEIDKILR